MRKSSLFLLTLVSACLVVSAQSWQRVGPEGGNVSGLARHPGNPNEMLAVTGGSAGQVLKSTDGGRTWQRIAVVNQALKEIAYDPSNANVVYVLPSYGGKLLKSTNGGVNWSELSFGANRYGTGGLAVDPANPSTIYVGGYDYYDPSQWKSCMAVFKSTNGGASWSAIRVGPQEGSASVMTVALSPSDSRFLFMSGYYWTGSHSISKVYKSSDRGATWQDITGSIGTARIGVIVVDPQMPSRVYAGSSWGIYRSTNGGATWARNTGTAYAEGLAVDPANTNTLYAGYSNRVHKSLDGGVNWTATTAGLAGYCRSMLVSSSGVFFGSTAGVYASRDSGGTWTASHQGIFAVEVASLGMSPSASHIVYAEGKGNGFFKSTNFGSSWQRMPDFYRCDSIDQILVNPLDCQDLYILAGG